MLVLILSSIILQILIGIALLILSRQYIVEHPQDERDEINTKRSNFINNIIVAGILILTVLNVFISAFGLEEGPKGWAHNVV